MWFALAHVHHLFEKLYVQKQPLASAVISTIVQLTYTSIFGAIATYLHVRTGSIAAPITCHMICNFVGLPDFSFFHPPGGLNSTSLSYMYPYRIVLVVLHGAGLLVFYCAVSTSTEATAEKSALWSLLTSEP